MSGRRMKMLDYRINTFLALCRNMNYRKTAEELNMTQPAVTQHIQFLERYYHCKLFSYSHHTLKLTPEAEIIKRYVENMQYQENKLMGKLGKQKNIHLKIGATKTIGEYVIGEHICNFLASPCNEISVVVDNTEVLMNELKEGILDFALIEGYFDREVYAFRHYKTESYLGLCNRHHEFAGKTIEMSEIIKHPLIIREEGSGTRMIFENVLSSFNLSLKMFPKVFCVSHFGLITKLLESNSGITFAYESVCQNNPQLDTFKIKGFEIQHAFNYVYLDDVESEKAVEYFERYK